MQKRILCFGDSLTWGYDPVKRCRMEDNERWTGVLQQLLGDEYKVIEEGQNGRTIAVDDPAEGEKNGLKYIIPCIESQSPLDIMIVMLGSNDHKLKFGFCAMDIAGEMQIFLEKVQTHNRYRMGGNMKILLIAPPTLGGKAYGTWLDECFDFKRTPSISKDIPSWYEKLSSMYDCEYLDASKIVEPSEADGVHLEADQQIKLGKAIYEKLKETGLIS
ncbi:MAG: SGNH/GDSL hydrolase family protein [Clostridiales bacterium]|nr:SGNH/GDSL hydrolase family protein [Clostridiales bacterium]